MQIIDQHRIKARPTAVNFATISLTEINLSQFYVPFEFVNSPSTQIASDKFANTFEVKGPSPLQCPFAILPRVPPVTLLPASFNTPIILS
jgi:hypothetical protein